MADKITLTLTDCTFFTNGSQTQSSQVIGYEDSGKKKHVVRYKLDIPSTSNGTHNFSVEKKSLGLGSDSHGATFGFYITTDEKSYINPDVNAPHFDLVKGTNSLSGDCEFVLLPNTTYYVWFFPTKEVTFGWYYWNYPSDISASGDEGAGITQIYINNNWEKALTYIYTNNDWKLVIPQVYISNNWKNTC